MDVEIHCPSAHIVEIVRESRTILFRTASEGGTTLVGGAPIDGEFTLKLEGWNGSDEIGGCAPEAWAAAALSGAFYARSPRRPTLPFHSFRWLTDGPSGWTASAWHEAEACDRPEIDVVPMQRIITVSTVPDLNDELATCAQAKAKGDGVGIIAPSSTVQLETYWKRALPANVACNNSLVSFNGEPVGVSNGSNSLMMSAGSVMTVIPMDSDPCGGAMRALGIVAHQLSAFDRSEQWKLWEMHNSTPILRSATNSEARRLGKCSAPPGQVFAHDSLPWDCIRSAARSGQTILLARSPE